ncbi:unnamed protein product [Schistosoma curassoni]|uniref:Uncharacterized protein n=1 Tax=Schistosoma curassoni TaxID=6186 RepID=A0A183KK01_9TREM|nr:unnamed protein product [Schistosoma curassoni]
MRRTKVSSIIDDSRRSKNEKLSPKGPALNRISRKVDPSVLHLPNDIQQETPRSRNRKARSASSGKHDLISQVADNPPESNSRFDATFVASPSNIDELVQVVRKEQRCDIKGNPAPKHGGLLLRIDTLKEHQFVADRLNDIAVNRS